MLQELCLVGGGVCVGMVAVLLIIDVFRAVCGSRANVRPPALNGNLQLFDENGKRCSVGHDVDAGVADAAPKPSTVSGLQ